MYLGNGHHHTIAWAADGGAQHQSYGLARAVGEENVVLVGNVAVAAQDEVAHLETRGGGTQKKSGSSSHMVGKGYYAFKAGWS